MPAIQAFKFSAPVDARAVPAGIIPPRIAAGCGKALTVVLFSLLTAMALLIATLVLLPAHSIAARAAGVPATQAPGQMEDEVLYGLFFPSSPDGMAFEAPQLSSDVRIDVTGMVARVNLRQRFTNPSDSWQEGIYVFPLPERSAVDRLVMTVGDRVITGQILEKEDAKRAYDAAAAAGKRASLLSSERPNVFVTSVANIGPGEEIIIDIEYQDSAVYRDGTFSLRFPMVVAPRYTPRDDTPQDRPETVDNSGTQTLRPEPAVFEPEARDVFGPVGSETNPVTLSMRLDPGFSLANLTSLYHPVDIETLDERRKVVTLRDGSVPANKDFVVEWRLASSNMPQAAVFVEEFDGESYVMMMVTPPVQESHPENLEGLDNHPALPPIPSRDIVFVIDTSGSMHGASIEQARAALSLAVSRLQPQDRFNVIRFDNETYSLFDGIVPVNADTLRRAQAYVNALEADGGTEMRPALLQALEMNTDAESYGADAQSDGRLQQVVFLTDGAVGNEAELFKLINEKLDSTRLFTVGIGSAPNSYFMRKAAEAGRGTFTYIGDPNEVSLKMSELLRKLERPALTDITLGWPGSAGKKIESYPSIIPDLYQGEPVVVIAKVGEVDLEALSGRVLVSGRQGIDSWQRRASLEQPSQAQGVASLWARAKFEEITDGLYLGRDPVAVRMDALEVALEHQLVTRYTSLVAIDDEPARPDDEALQSHEVPRELPEGWSHEKVFGSEESLLEPEPEPAALPAPQPAKSKIMPARKLPASIAGMALAAKGEAVQLPQTATPAALNAMLGIFFILLGGLLFVATGRRSNGFRDHA
ncbi:marine proteobacterial sortase target protein [Pelagibius sp. Alg239-R121]|uniref:marine proteobacterial sortase target protein n=1 Tax=Pelagibius sp. Alg239-R121 TaxID=2993448 RepID=UPI0024A64E41|nr:marine proteobacterial sortase target protein [Pelagibius sp. Alg239-R121]